MPDQKKYDTRLNVFITADLQRKLEQVRDQRGPKVTTADVVRDAIRQYLDNEEDIIGSRRHFQKHLRESLDEMQRVLTWQQFMLFHFLWSTLSSFARAQKVSLPTYSELFENALALNAHNWTPLLKHLDDAWAKRVQAAEKEKKSL